MAIKDPLVGGSIQSSALKTKCRCMNQIVRQVNAPQGGDPFTLISEKWFLDMLGFHGCAFVNHLLHFKM